MYMSNVLTAEMVKVKLESISNKTTDCITYGLRSDDNAVIPSDYTSYHWDFEFDKPDYDRPMYGICTQGIPVCFGEIDDEDKLDQILELSLSYGNRYIHIMCGDLESYGDDDIGDEKVLAYGHKSLAVYDTELEEWM